MNIFKIFEKSKRKDCAIVLYCLLNRIPIILIGKDTDIVDEILIELTNLIPFRKELVFYTDFISQKEIDEIIMNESNDYNSVRICIRCPTNVSNKALEQFNSLDNFIIGFQQKSDNNRIKSLRKLLLQRTDKALIINLRSNLLDIEILGMDIKEKEVSFENMIFEKISEDTEKAIIRMKRVLTEKIIKKDLDKDLIQILLDFENEKDELKRNIFKKEIQNFYSGSKRAFSILTRLNLLTNMEIQSTIGAKTLLETIDYSDATISRILIFIRYEWNEDFSNIIENNRLDFIGDKLQSFWG